MAAKKKGHIWQVDRSNKTAKEAAHLFSITQFAEPRQIVGFKPDGTFKLKWGLRTYRVVENGDMWTIEIVDSPAR